jgi:hypothetical protein
VPTIRGTRSSGFDAAARSSDTRWQGRAVRGVCDPVQTRPRCSARSTRTRREWTRPGDQRRGSR